jgi:hypothetical protein
MRRDVTGGRLWGGSPCFLPPLGFLLLLGQAKRRVKNVLRYEEALMAVKAIYTWLSIACYRSPLLDAGKHQPLCSLQPQITPAVYLFCAAD